MDLVLVTVAVIGTLGEDKGKLYAVTITKQGVGYTGNDNCTFRSSWSTSNIPSKCIPVE